MSRRDLLCRLSLLAVSLVLAGCPAATPPSKDANPPTGDKLKKDEIKPPTDGEEPIKPPRHDPGR